MWNETTNKINPLSLRSRAWEATPDASDLARLTG
jgi:hypothetical protein